MGKQFFVVVGMLLLSSVGAQAHFGMVIPDRAIVGPERKTLDLTLSFSHPAERVGMEMVKPQAFYMVKEGHKTDLLTSLKPAKVFDHSAWSSRVRFQRPGVYTFVLEPTPYWEPAEDLSIIHITKTVVSVFGDDAGWDQPLGLKTEIVPLLRPFGNYAGNSFVGQVLLNGKPVPYAEVEVERYNNDKRMTPVSDLHVTQVVKADGNGVFTFCCPIGGWWGFAALNEADFTLKNPQGDEKGVELGAVLWIWLDEVK